MDIKALAFSVSLRLAHLVVGLLLVAGALSQDALKIELTNVHELGPNVNDKSEEIKPILSPSKNILYFTRIFHPENKGDHADHDIWASRFTDNGWEKASNDYPSLNNALLNMVIGISNDEKSLYITNINGQDLSEVKGVYVSRWENEGFGDPQLIPIPGLKFNSEFYGFYMSPEEDVLIISMEGDYSFGKEDLYVSTKNDQGQWSSPIHLGPNINSAGFETSPFLSADQKIIFFSSNGHGGFGDADIFYSERLDDTWNNWSKPQNLGSKVNSNRFDAYFFMDREGKKAFFASNKTNKDNSNIYSADIKISSVTDSTELLWPNDNSHHLTSAAGILQLNNTPATGIELNLVDENDVVIYQTKTDQNGYFNFDQFIPNRNYSIEVKKQDKEVLENSDMFLTSSNGDKMVFLQNDSIGLFGFKVLSGERYESLEALEESARNGKVVDKAASISGIVSAGSFPSEGLSLELKDNSGATIQTITTDSKGHFKIDNFIPEKNYFVSIDENSAGLVDVFEVFLSDDNDNKKESVVINKTDKRLFEFKSLPSTKADDIALMDVDGKTAITPTHGFIEQHKRKNSIGGILQFNKLPAINVELSMLDENDAVIKTTRTDEQGFFNFEMFELDRDYTISIESGDSSLLSKSMLYLANDVENMRVYINKESNGMFAFKALSGEKYEDLRTLESDIKQGKVVEPYTTSISGTFNYQKLPKQSITLHLLDEEDRVIQTTTADPNGYFKFENFTAGRNYLISVDKKASGLSDIYEIYLGNESTDNNVIISKVDKHMFAFTVLPSDTALLPLEDSVYVSNQDPPTARFSSGKSSKTLETSININDLSKIPLNQIVRQMLDEAKGNNQLIIVRATKHILVNGVKTQIKRVNPEEANDIVSEFKKQGIKSNQITVRSLGNEQLIITVIP